MHPYFACIDPVQHCKYKREANTNTKLWVLLSSRSCRSWWPWRSCSCSPLASLRLREGYPMGLTVEAVEGAAEVVEGAVGQPAMDLGMALDAGLDTARALASVAVEAVAVEVAAAAEVEAAAALDQAAGTVQDMGWDTAVEVGLDEAAVVEAAVVVAAAEEEAVALDWVVAMGRGTVRDMGRGMVLDQEATAVEAVAVVAVVGAAGAAMVMVQGLVMVRGLVTEAVMGGHREVERRR